MFVRVRVLVGELCMFVVKCQSLGLLAIFVGRRRRGSLVDMLIGREFEVVERRFGGSLLLLRLKVGELRRMGGLDLLGRLLGLVWMLV
jgi:hypothetical protein